MLNRRVGNTGSKTMNPRASNMVMPAGGSGAMGKSSMPQVTPARPGMKKGGKVGSSCMKKGGAVMGKPMAKYASGGMVKADGAAMRGKTKGKNC